MFFETIRKHQRVVLGLILILILPAFVLFGVSGHDMSGAASSPVAEVNGTPIPRAEFDNAHRISLQDMQRMFGSQQVPVSLLDTPQSRESTLDRLIIQQVLADTVRRNHLQVSPDDVRKAIVAIPGLSGQDGRFDRGRYDALLAEQGLTPPAFEARVRDELAMRQITDSVAATAYMPRVVQDHLATLETSRRVYRSLTLSPGDFEKGIEVSDDDIAAWYKGHSDAYRSEESVDVEWLELSRDALAKSATPDEDALNAWFKANAGKLSVPDQRRASHILIEVPEGADEAVREAAKKKADAILAEVRADPESFDRLARERSDDTGTKDKGGDLGFFSPELMVKPFSDAAFKLKPGELAPEPVRSEFGYHIIKVTDQKGSDQPALADVRDQVEAAVRSEQSQKRYAEQAEKLIKALTDDPKSLEGAASRIGIKPQAATGLTRNVEQPADAPEALRNADLRNRLFAEAAIREGQVTEPVEARPGVLVVARVTKHHAAEVPALDTVRDRVRKEVLQDKARKAMQAKGEALLASARKEGADAPEGLSTKEQFASRAEPGELPQAAQTELFKLGTGSLPAWAGVDLGAQGWMLLQLVRVENPMAAGSPNAEQKAVIERLHTQLRQLEGQTMVGLLLEGFRQGAKVTRHELPMPDVTNE